MIRRLGLDAARVCPLCGTAMTLTLRATRSTFRCPNTGDLAHWSARRERRHAGQLTAAQGVPSWEHFGPCQFCGADWGDPCTDRHDDMLDLPHRGRPTI
jgi:predicted RNA-binding Zn-ribbon protein involved in translation (DUF1610 family)